MALLFSPHCISLFNSGKQSICTPKLRFRCSLSAVKMSVESGAAKVTGRAILWYKHDLRVDDHPGLIAASKHQALVPVYVFDHRILSRDLPMLDDLKKFLYNYAGTSNSTWMLIKKLSAKDELLKKAAPITTVADTEKADSGESSAKDMRNKNAQRKRPDKSAFVSELGNSVGGGTRVVLNALAAYLRYLEGTARDEWQEVHRKLRQAETREGASFGALFGSALLLGIVSRRRVYNEAITYEKQRNGGFLSPLRFSAVTVAAVVNTICSMEWYWILALKGEKTSKGNFSHRIWRWKGYIVRYTVAGNEGPAVLLVHGFGAFLEHYRHNINEIAQNRNRVWAITLLGFGKSEKPNVLYTELMWAELLRDFISEVVGEPVHLVGNSIGGLFVSFVAGLWPSLARSVVLINSAGNVIPGYSPARFFEDRQTSGATWLGARLLLFYLRFNIRNIVKSFYPTRSDRADNWLIDEMLRASFDPGVPVVLESIFSFDLSVPLNYLLGGLERRILIIQGMKDPLADSKSKLVMLKEHCRGVVIRELDAGHCPHDELPEEVNSIIQEWIVELESRVLSVGST